MWRLATSLDLERIAELGRQATSGPRWSDAQYRSMVGDASRIVLVAKQAEEICGFSVIHLIGDQAELENIVIADEARGKGQGTALLRAALQLAGRRGVRRILLEVRASNAPALRLYKKMGFVDGGRRKNYYSDPQEDAILMELRPPK